MTVDGKPGIKATYAKLDMSNLNNPAANKPVAERVEETIDETKSNLPSEAASVTPLAIRWEGMLTATETGDYNLGLIASGFFRMQLDGKSVTSSYGGDGKQAKLGRVHLEAGKPGKLDHLVVDSKSQRLFQANKVNNTLDVVDLKAGKLLKQIPGQGGAPGRLAP